MTDIAEMVERLRGGCNCNLESSPCMAEDDCRLDMEAANALEAMQARAETAEQRLKECEAALEPFEDSAKHRVADAPEWRASEVIAINVTIGQLRAARAYFAKGGQRDG